MPVYYNPYIKNVEIKESGLILDPKDYTYSFMSVPESWLLPCNEVLPSNKFWIDNKFWSVTDFWDNDTYKSDAPFPATSKFFINPSYAKYGLVLKSYEYSYNPILARHDITFDSAGSKVLIINVLTTDYLEISNVDVMVQIYINDINNVPPIVVMPCESVVMNIKRRVSRIILISEDKGGITIKEMLDDIKYERQNRNNYALETVKD